jgi:hypothetical protein
MNRSYGGGKTPYGKQAPGKPKIIYSDQEVYAGQTKNGDFYLFHTTLDPDEQFKMRKIGSLAEKPPREYVEEKVVYGLAGEKIKWRLNKEKVSEWIEDEFNFGFSAEPSPWAPKKFGEKRQRTQAPPDDSDSEGEAKPPPVVQSKENNLSKRVEDCFLLLQEIVTILRHDGKTGGVTQEDDK